MLVSQLIMSIEDRGRWLGFHLRAALPFGSGSKFCEAALRVAGRLRVGVLGTAFAGEGHIAAYNRLPGVEVTGLWNRTKTRAESLAQTRIPKPNGL